MSPKPLQHIRILEIGGYIAAPYSTSILCALGAEVVKVEKPQGGDDFRRDLDHRSPYFVQYNAGKKSIAVDVKRPEGVDLVRALLPKFDVLIENIRPGKLAALGLGPGPCRDVNPDLVYTSVTGFGSGGPLVDRAAYDTIGQALGGMYTVMGDAGEPQLSGTCIADLITGFVGATGILAALVARAQTGTAVRIETSMLEAVSALTVDALTQMYDDGTDPHRQSRHPQAQNFCLPTASEGVIAIHLSSSQKFWRSLTDAIGRPDLLDDPRFSDYPSRVQHYSELVSVVTAEFRTRTAEQWEKILTDADVPFAPVLGMSEFATHPQTEFLELLQPQDEGPALLRSPWRFDGARPSRTGSTPRVGEHTRAVAAEVYDETTIDTLLRDGVLYAP
ncbi:CaiB/BaiF CoA transferase family protein [Rhodococcus sp. JS3073]|uniref:CaiB/BaiF CoA transferase family protein n=1 Tax=Rhodococcus sp. JS3073 TaxID=3002901 RepID=UPI002285BECC|nr:CoA transferase [Rhodococcus sp. JS3073]WAM19699.1 CoA transferase [Rhodococcus sp. JS3073]